jgi:hypothetical protein
VRAFDLPAASLSAAVLRLGRFVFLARDVGYLFALTNLRIDRLAERVVADSGGSGHIGDDLSYAGAEFDATARDLKRTVSNRDDGICLA